MLKGKTIVVSSIRDSSSLENDSVVKWVQLLFEQKTRKLTGREWGTQLTQK